MSDPSFIEELKATLDDIRGIPSALGLTPWTIQTYNVQWSGIRTGEGTKTVTTGTLTLSNGQTPWIRAVSQRDIIASNNFYQDLDIIVGPLTPQFSSSLSQGGQSLSAPTLPGTTVQESFYYVTGSAFDGYYKRQALNTVSPTSYELLLRRTNSRP